MYISDDHVFYGSLTLAFLAFLTLSLAFTEAQSVRQFSYSKASKFIAPKIEPIKVANQAIQFRTTLNTSGSQAKEKIAQAILSAGFRCSQLSYIRPMALSGVFQATCLDQSTDVHKEYEVHYIYNVKSGFVHLM